MQLNIIVNITNARNDIISMLAQVPIGLTWVRLAYAATDVNIVTGMRRAKQEQGTHIIKPADIKAVRRGTHLDPIKYQSYVSIGYQDNATELGTAVNLKIWLTMKEKDITVASGTSPAGPLLRGTASTASEPARVTEEPACHCESRYLAAVGHTESCAYGNFRKALRMKGAI